MPEWWVLNHIYEDFRDYLVRHGGTRPRAPTSTHYALQPGDVEQWRGRWDLLQILPDDP